MQRLLESTVHANNECPPAFIACNSTAKETGKKILLEIIIIIRVLVVIQSTGCCDITIPDDKINSERH